MSFTSAAIRQETVEPPAPAPPPGQGEVGSREERTIEACENLIDIVSALFNVSGREVREPGRGSLGVARVRQIAMYVAHVALELNMTEVGRGFGRDRTTVQHACHLVEDMRDHEEFDRLVAVTERIALVSLRPRPRPRDDG